MGYFSNGTEGESYYEDYCSKCVHEKGCPVWMLHMLHNYDECNKEDSFLHALIPRSKDGLSNESCTMFVQAELPPHPANPTEQELHTYIEGLHKQLTAARTRERQLVESVELLPVIGPSGFTATIPLRAASPPPELVAAVCDRASHMSDIFDRRKR